MIPEPAMNREKLLTQLSTYLMASILGTVLHYFVLFILVNIFSLQIVFASTCGAIAGAVVIYFLNYFLVFKSVRRHREALVRFLLVAVFGIFLNGIVLNFLESTLVWHYLALQLITTIIVFISNFILNRSWTFSVGRVSQQPRPPTG
ncbi:MAG: GtrA family protein [Desulfuromusa sp.]|nr:GtrA family protein [Desulfuromusa sp.]